eukprot:TRINITY_DN578_c0_g1_i2.p1 TRINITY_DN578_c0_g1~~TRINITY_DN578_c0_g1_i2.p1  ORF type:complete len:231 (+),score=80.84 TRINITY_DN578_c0_g1_i2:125-817(+)
MCIRDSLTTEELHTFLSKLFRGARGQQDEQEAPVLLAPVDFKRVLLSTDVGFTPEQMRRMLVEADESEEGQIDCDAFVDAVVHVIATLSSKQTFKDQEKLREREAEELAKEFSVHDHSREQLEGVLNQLFAAEENPKGLVNRRGLYRVVHELKGRLNLERREVNALMISADENHEGMLQYDQFVPLAYDVLRQSILDILIDNTPHSSQLEEYIINPVSYTHLTLPTIYSV